MLVYWITADFVQCVFVIKWFASWPVVGLSFSVECGFLSAVGLTLLQRCYTPHSKLVAAKPVHVFGFEKELRNVESWNPQPGLQEKGLCQTWFECSAHKKLYSSKSTFWRQQDPCLDEWYYFGIHGLFKLCLTAFSHITCLTKLPPLLHELLRLFIWPFPVLCAIFQHFT